MLFGSSVYSHRLEALPAWDAERAVADAMARIRSCDPGDVELLEAERVTSKSVVLRVSIAGRLAYAKTYAAAAAFHAELAIYALLEKSDLSPRVIPGCEEALMLITEDLKTPERRNVADDWLWLFQSVGRIHGIWERFATTAYGLVGSRRGWRPSAMSDCEARIAATFSDRLPPNWSPMSIGDVKLEHVVGPATRRRLIDYDAAEIGRFDLVDVVIGLVRCDATALDWADLLLAYDDGRASEGSRAGPVRGLLDDFRRVAANIAADDEFALGGERLKESP
jgi:hypothetical protein